MRFHNLAAKFVNQERRTLVRACDGDDDAKEDESDVAVGGVEALQANAQPEIRLPLRAQTSFELFRKDYIAEQRAEHHRCLNPANDETWKELTDQFSELPEPKHLQYDQRAESSKPAARLARQLVKSGKAPVITDQQAPLLPLPPPAAPPTDDAIIPLTDQQAPPLPPPAAPPTDDAIIPAAGPQALAPTPHELSVDLICGVDSTSDSTHQAGSLRLIAEPRAPRECSPLHPMFLKEFFRADKKKGKGLFGDDPLSQGGALVAASRFKSLHEAVHQGDSFPRVVRYGC